MFSLNLIPRRVACLSTQQISSYPLKPISRHYHPSRCRRSPARLANRCSRSTFPFHVTGSLRRLSSLPPDKNDEGKPRRTAVFNDLIRENIYTIPNALTVSRILSCPFLAWSIANGNFAAATGVLAYAGVSDWVDGFLARRYQMRSVLGTILDPAADKALMTTLTVTLALKGMVPVPLAVMILGRDVLLSFAAFYIRYKTLTPPKTFQRYWDFSIPSAEVHPTRISKINTLLQLLLMGVTTASPLLTFNTELILRSLQWTVAGTTIWSGLSYVFSTSAVRIITSKSFRK